MIGILLVTHGRLAEELRAAALTIQPGLERIVALALEWSETGEDAREKIRRGLEQADEGDGVVILTDMFGGTPTNLTLPFLRKDRVEIVTGVNLPIYVASDLLAEEAAPASDAEKAEKQLP
jgi:PTS system mannose-specific IIA component